MSEGPPPPAISATEQARPGRSLLAFVPVAMFGVIALMFVAALQKPGDPSLLPSMLIGKLAPAVTLPPLEGLTADGVPVPGISPTDFARGTPVIVNFWQSSCAPCVAEHPLLIILHDKSGVPVLGINTKDSAAGARRLLNRYGSPFAAVGVDGNGRAAIEWGVYGMPETFVLDGHGRVVYKHVGEVTPDTIEKVLIPAIEKARTR